MFDRWRVTLNWRLIRARERFWSKLAWAVPRQLAYWCTIRVGVNATQGEHSNQVVPDLAFMDALKRWETAT